MPHISWPKEPQIRQFQRALLAKARERGISDIGSTKLLGLLYLVDVECIARYGEPATDIEWVWKHYGPFNAEAAYGPRSDPAIDERPMPGPYEGTCYLLLVEKTLGLEHRIDGVIEDILDKFGRWGGTNIKRYCYANTEPMIDIQKSGKRGDRLNMSLARREEPVDRETADELIRVVDLVGESRPSVNYHSEELAEAIDSGALLRARATRRVADES